MTYRILLQGGEKAVVWLHGALKTPPLSEAARIRAGVLLRRLQNGQLLAFPDSRPMPVIGPRCHELRIRDGRVAWRVYYRIDLREILVLDVEKKQSRATSQETINACRHRLRRHDGWRWGM
jgi:phage-related protein